MIWWMPSVLTSLTFGSRGMNREQIYEMMAMAKVDAVCRKIPDASTQAKVQKFLGRAVEEEEA